MVVSRYAELTAPGQFAFREEELTINDDQLLVRIKAAGICMWEMHHYKGEIGTFPQRIGHEPAGIVEEVGANVTDFVPGDRVTGLFQPGLYQKAFATYGIAYPQWLVKIPDHVPFEHAIGEPLKCVATIIRAATPEFGDYVLLIGCGAMGLLTLAGLVGNACEEIIAVDLKDERLKLAEEIGATVTLNPDKCDFEAEIKRITQGRGVDVAIEAAGHPGPIDMASLAMRESRGKLVIAGFHGEPASIDLSRWCYKGMITLTAHPPHSLNPMDDLRRAIKALARGVFPMDKIVTHTFPLDKIKQAFEIAKSGREGYIKGVITP